MDMQLAGRSAYITGGAQGIGAAVAARLSAEGVRVAVSDIAGDELRTHRDEWTCDAGEPVLIEADLSTARGVRAATEEAIAGLGGVPNILVNNVGVAISRAFTDIDDESWTATFELNFMSYVRTSRLLVPRMAEAGPAAVVNMSSDLAKQPESVPADYGSMKAAILYLTKALAQEFAPAVRTNAVLPGPVWTGLWSRPGGVVDRLADLYGTDRDAALERYLKDRQLTFGIAEPDDVAAMVTYLVSPIAGRINGSAFDVGGTIRGLV
jgi:NAD(P)-dependent dehydrogenase (short-subunit alcohol dehydrogenase family)